MRVDLKYVKKQTRKRHSARKGGVWQKTYYYYRRPGAPDDGARLPGEPSSPEFMATLREFNARADNKPAAPAPGSFAELVTRFRAAPEFQELAPKSKKDYGRILDGLVAKFGRLPYADIDREVVFALRDSLKDKPRTANYTLAVLRRVLGWAFDRSMIPANPAAQPKHLKVAPRSEVWSAEAEAKFMAEAPPPMILAIMLGLYTAQRQDDLLRMTWHQYRDGRLSLRQAKTGKLVEVPCHTDLKDILDRLPRTSTHIMTQSNGRPFKADHFRHEWRKVTLAAGLDGLQFRDLRRTAMVRLAEAGATEIEIAAVSGHEIEATRRILETYIPRNPAMAAAAIRKLESAKSKA